MATAAVEQEENIDSNVDNTTQSHHNDFITTKIENYIPGYVLALDSIPGLTFKPHELKLSLYSAILKFEIEFTSENFQIEKKLMCRSTIEVEWLLQYLLKYYMVEHETSLFTSIPLQFLLKLLEHVLNTTKEDAGNFFLNYYQSEMSQKNVLCLVYFFHLAFNSILSSEHLLNDPTLQAFFTIDSPLPVLPSSNSQLVKLVKKLPSVLSMFNSKSNCDTTYDHILSISNQVYGSTKKCILSCNKLFSYKANVMTSCMKFQKYLCDEPRDESWSILRQVINNSVNSTASFCYAAFPLIFTFYSQINGLYNLQEVSKSAKSAEKKDNIERALQNNLVDIRQNIVKESNHFVPKIIDDLIELQMKIVLSLESFINEVKAF